MLIIAHQIVRTEVALVVPTVRLFGEDAGYAVAIQGHPLIAGPIEANGQIFQALCVNLPDWLLGEFFGAGNLAVLEFQWRERFFQIPIRLVLDRLENIPRLGDTADERSDGAFSVRKLGGAHQAIIDAQLLREMMEHEHATAKGVGAHLEAGAIRREGVLPDWPM